MKRAAWLAQGGPGNQVSPRSAGRTCNEERDAGVFQTNLLPDQSEKGGAPGKIRTPDP